MLPTTPVYPAIPFIPSMKLYKFAVPVIKTIQKINSNTVIIENGIIKNCHTIKAEIITCINKRTFEDRVKISSKNPINPAIPAINVKALSWKKKDPIITKASQIPIPPPLGVGREWELRMPGLSTKANRCPIFEIATAQNRLKRKGRVIAMNIME